VAPFISVIVPTYQRRAFVERAAASVLSQSSRDFELIVVDDGSTDGTGEALAALGDRIRYVRQDNRGTSAARNTGLSLARGEIIAFLDSDDVWLPDHLETITAIFALHPTAVLAGTCPDFLAAGRDPPERARLVEPLPRMLIANAVGYVSCVAVRQDALEKTGGFGKDLEPAEYTDFVLRIALQGPFALLHRRTVVPQRTRGSLLDRGRSSGRYLEVLCGIVERTAEATRELPVGQRAEGARRFFDALRALNAGQEDEARAALRDACRLYPELNTEPVLVGRQLLNAMPAGSHPAGRLQLTSAMAGLWPSPDSETAAGLRAYAVVAALRAGRPGDALRLLRTLRRRDVKLIVGRRHDVANIVRRSLATVTHRGRESALLDRGATSDGP
jgi:hypothetical protein